MTVKFPQLDGVKVNEDRTLPYTILQAIRRAYEYISQLDATVGSGVVYQDLHVNRNNLYPAINENLGSWYIETDRSDAIYMVMVVNAAHAWVLLYGFMRGLLANRPADLGPNDTDFLYSATNASDYRWNGTSWDTLDGVRGASNLTHAGAIPKVSTPGVLVESSLTDSGSIVSGTLPLHLEEAGTPPPELQLKITNNSVGVMGLCNKGVDAQFVFYDLDWTGGGYIARHAGICTTFKNAGFFQMYGGVGNTVGIAPTALNFLFSVNLANGNVNTPGVYQVAGTQVVGPRLAAVTPPIIATTGIFTTAGATYTATEQGMLNTLKAAVSQLNGDVNNLQTAINSILAILSAASGGHGLTA
jgi:hypothetical protein